MSQRLWQSPDCRTTGLSGQRASSTALLGRIALAEDREPRASDGRAREVEMRVVETGAYEGIAQIEHARPGSGKRADTLGAPDGGDPVARDGDGAGSAGISDGGEETVRPDDEVDGHVALQSAGRAGLCDNSGTACSPSQRMTHGDHPPHAPPLQRHARRVPPQGRGRRRHGRPLAAVGLRPQGAEREPQHRLRHRRRYVPRFGHRLRVPGPLDHRPREHPQPRCGHDRQP